MVAAVAALQALGLWSWLLAGLVLIGLELIVPGIFIIWFGAGAVATALVCAILAPFWAIFNLWQTQIALFPLFSIAFVLIGRSLSLRRARKNDNPFLNRRTDALLGQIVTLEEAIENGHGYIRLGDSLWRIHGPDLPAGRSIRLVAFDNGAFTVKEVQS